MVPATYPSAPYNQHPHHYKQYPPDAMSTGPNRESYPEHNTTSTLAPQQEYDLGTFPPYPYTYHEPYTTVKAQVGDLPKMGISQYPTSS